MLAFLKKNKNNPHVKRLLGTLADKYSDSVSITLDNRPFFVYGSYGQLRIGHGGKVSRWNDSMKKALTKYIGEAVLYEKVTPGQVSKAFDNVAKVSLELIKNLESYKKAPIPKSYIISNAQVPLSPFGLPFWFYGLLGSFLAYIALWGFSNIKT